MLFSRIYNISETNNGGNQYQFLLGTIQTPFNLSAAITICTYGTTGTATILVYRSLDVNHSGAIDNDDLVEVWQNEFTQNLPSRDDVNASGTVDVSDLIIVWQLEFKTYYLN